MEEVHLQKRRRVISAHDREQDWRKRKRHEAPFIYNIHNISYTGTQNVLYIKRKAVQVHPTDVFLNEHIPPNMLVKCLWMTAWELLSLWVAENWTIAFRPASWNRETSHKNDLTKTNPNPYALRPLHYSCLHVNMWHPTCLFCRDPKSGLSSSCNMFSVKTGKYILRTANRRRRTVWHDELSLTVPMAWIVKAHVFQTIRGTRGHSSLGAVCSPTLWTVVAHTTSISTMLSENFLLKNNQRQRVRLLRYWKHWYSSNTEGAESFTHGSCTP